MELPGAVELPGAAESPGAVALPGAVEMMAVVFCGQRGWTADHTLEQETGMETSR